MLAIIPARYLAFFAGAIVLVLVMLGFMMGRSSATPAVPSEASADAGFARDMQIHHTQAVEMSMLVLERTDDPGVRSMAYDLALTQQQQNGQMFAWLRQWGLPQTSVAGSMAWMHDTPHGLHGRSVAGAVAGPMPGMASAADVERLRNAAGRDADTIFLTLMISHHQGGVIMAEAAVQRAATEDVRSLATKMVAAQATEITAMRQLLDH